MTVRVQVPWWRDESLKIALLSQTQRQIKIINTLTHQEHLIDVGSHTQPS